MSNLQLNSGRVDLGSGRHLQNKLEFGNDGLLNGQQQQKHTSRNNIVSKESPTNAHTLQSSGNTGGMRTAENVAL